MARMESKAEALRPPLGPGIVVPITSFAPEPYDVIRQIIAVVQSSEEGYIAGFFDANVYAFGDTEEEALRNLKSMILDVFDSLSREPDPTLGPEPRRQLAVFREFIVRRGADDHPG